jgi:hypothetical protein
MGEGSNGAVPQAERRKEGDHMKRQAFGALAMLSLLIVMTAVSVSPQSQRSKVTNIPFSFIVGQKTLPAGEYTVEPNRRDSDNVWLVQSSDRRVTALFTTMPVRANETQEKAKLVFHKYGDQYFLSQIWTAGDIGGRELPMRRPERELAKNGVKPKTVALIVGSKN